MSRPFRYPGKQRRIAAAAAALAAAAAAVIAQPAAAATAAPAAQASSARASAAAGSCYPKTEFYLANTDSPPGDGWQTACGYVWYDIFPAQLVAVQDVSRPLERIWIHYFPPGGETLQSACIFTRRTFEVPSEWQVHDLLVSQNRHPC